jgi:hypothetical protein
VNAQTLEAPQPKPLRWTADRRYVFDVIEPAALSIVATDGPVSVTLYDVDHNVRERIGHNRAVWPARAVKGAAWRDHATTAWDRSPVHSISTKFRIWLLTTEQRDRAAEAVVDHMVTLSERNGSSDALYHGFVDLGRNWNLAEFGRGLRETCRRLRLVVWDDYDLAEWFDSVMTRTREICAEKGWELNPALVEQVAMRDVSARLAEMGV